MDTAVDMTYSSSAQLSVAISNFNASLFPVIWVLSLMNYAVILKIPSFVLLDLLRYPKKLSLSVFC